MVSHDVPNGEPFCTNCMDSGRYFKVFPTGGGELVPCEYCNAAEIMGIRANSDDDPDIEFALCPDCGGIHLDGECPKG